MVGTNEKVQAPWVMKRMVTNNEGKIIVTDETPTVDLLPDQPAPDQPPFAKYCVVTEAFRGPSPNHPSSAFVNYKCPKCSKSSRIALDNIWPGNKIVQCECGEKITLPLAFDIPALDKPEPQVAQAVNTTAVWTKFWGTSNTTWWTKPE